MRVEAGPSGAGQAQLFAALGDETRLAPLARLGGGAPQSISALSAHFPLSRQGVTRHLSVMEGAGLVRRERVGRESLYRLEPAALRDAQDYLARAAAQWDGAIDRLAAHLATDEASEEVERPPPLTPARSRS